MPDFDLHLLERLCQTVAVSGHEEPMGALMADEFRARGLDPRVDALGNVIARAVPEQPSGPHLLFHAHMDQLGFIVTQVLPSGFLRVERIGGVARQCGVGTEVVVVTPQGLVPGVMGIKAHHMAAPGEEFQIPPITDWYLDIGATSREEALPRGVDIGRVVAFTPRFRPLTGTRVSAPSLDNRVGCYVLLELARALAGRQTGCPVTLVASVLEEFNLRGLAPAARAAAPDLAIGLDITPGCDTPDLAGRGSVVLGGGPAIKIMDFHGRGTVDGLMAAPKIVQSLEEAAATHGIAVQKEVILGVLTEGSRVVSLLEGVPTGGISIPTRYTHTPVETADTTDMEGAVELAVGSAELLNGL